MTPEQLAELSGLLSRIEAAGGPAQSARSGWWRVSWPDSDAGKVHTGLGSAEVWSRASSALLIHALKLDARARGWNADTAELVSGKERSSEVSLWHVDGHQHQAQHDVEVIAWCYAWIRAFERSAPAATESDQLVSNGSAE